MGKKTISNTFTVNTIIDGESAPYYFQEWFAWSNDPSTSSVITPPTISGSWATSIPAQGSYAYLWRKSIRYVWNESTRQYIGETAQYVRMTGTNGTSINIRGKVADASSRGNGSATIITDSGTQTITLSDGDAVTQLDNGHLYQWVIEGGGKWLDLGQFKGESGKTYYTHIAWATNVNYNSSGVVTRVDGFTIDKSPNDTTHLWMGVLVNEDSSTDSSDALDYTWSYTKGVDGFSVQAQYAPNNNPSSSQIHNTWQNGDIYMRTKQSNETNWSSWNKIVGENGGETNYQFAISANKVSQDGTSATAPTDISSSDWQDAPLIVTTAKPYLWSKVQKKDGNGNNVGNPSYMRLTGEESIEYSVEGALNTIKVGAGQTSTLVSCTYTFYQKPAVSSTRSTVSCYYAVYLRSGNTFSLLTMSTGYNNHGSGTSVSVNSNVPYKSGSVVYNAVVIYIFPSSYYSTSPESQNYMAKKEIPIVKDGDTAFVVDLENEMTNVALDENGNLIANFDMYFKVRAYYGTTNVLSDSACSVSASCSNPNVTITDTNAKTTGIRVQISSGTHILDTTEVSVTVTHTTYGTRTVIFTLAGVRGGENAVLQELLPSLDAISFARTAAGGLTPSSRDLTLSIKKTQGGSTSTQSISDSGLTIRWSSTSMPASKTGGNGWGNGTATGIYFNNTTMQIANTVAATNIYIAAFNSAGTLVDRETIPVIKDGEKGEKGDSVSYDEEHSSIGYAYSSMGTPEAGRDYPSDITSWSQTPPAVQKGKYLWTKDVTAYDNAGTIVYTTTYGVQYQPNDGESVEIDSSRTFIKYCRQTKSQYTGQHPADSNFSTTYPTNLGQGDYLWILNQVAYVGVANPLKSYSVSMLGTDGSKGDSGADGYTTHFAYATSADGSQNFSTTNFNGATYIGTYRDQRAADSTNYRDYVWTPWKGDKGEQGEQGEKGDKGDKGDKGQDGKDGLAPNQNILLRTVFDRGIDKVKENWAADWDYVGIDAASDTVIDGRKSIRISAEYASTYKDFTQNVYGKIKTSTWYTLSFYYFSTSDFWTYIYDGANTHGVVDTTAGYYIDGVYNSGSLDIDGHHQWGAEWQGKRHSITFKTKSSFGTTNALILFRCPQGVQLAICMPKLEMGKDATTYIPNEDDLVGNDGQDGARGKVGRFFYFGGTFDSSDSDPTHTFVVNDSQAPYFEHTENGQKRYHVFNYETNGSYTMAQMWAISSNWNNKPWEVMTNDFKYIITEALFGAYAHLDSFIINEDWMLSQYGELVQPSGNIITVNASNVNTKYSGNSPVVLNGNHVNNGIIVYKVSFNVSSATTITIKLTTSSESNYDFGAVGKVDNDSFLSATASSIKSDSGSVTSLKTSGSSTVSTSISLNAGSHYLYIGYFKDGSSNVGNDNASFDISGATYNLTEAKKTSGMSMSGGPRSIVPYGWFDPTDPEVKTLPTSGYKFRPAFAVDGLTGETYQQSAHIKGAVTATGGSITGDLDVTGGLNVKNSSNAIKVKINGGSVSKTGSEEITIVDAEGFYVKRGSEGFRLTTQGFQRWNSSAGGWVNFYGGRYVRTVTSFTYTISLNDDLIIAKPFSSGQRVYLPSSNVPDGKIITIINAGAYGLYVNGNGHNIVGASEYSEVTLNINDRMEFIYSSSSNNKWYANYMPKVDNNS